VRCIGGDSEQQRRVGTRTMQQQGSNWLATSNALDAGTASVVHFKCWRILRPHLTPIVDPSRRDVGMAQPFQDFGYVGIVIEGVGGSRGAECMGAVLQPHRNLLTLSRTAKSRADIFTRGQLMLRMRNGDAE
jgi:hypothetical protein